MITYEEYIKKMEEKGYICKNDTIYKSNPMIAIFNVEKGTTGKFLELTLPNDTIISACGKDHEGGCQGSYYCNIELFDEKDKQPFQDLHYSTKLTNTRYLAAEIVLTKILNKDPNQIDSNYKEWAIYNNPILELIKSKTPYEHVMWAGVYKIFSKEFLKTSFNLNNNEKMTFYAINPDIDITKISFELKADVLELKCDNKQ